MGLVLDEVWAQSRDVLSSVRDALRAVSGGLYREAASALEFVVSSGPELRSIPSGSGNGLVQMAKAIVRDADELVRDLVALDKDEAD